VEEEGSRRMAYVLFLDEVNKKVRDEVISVTSRGDP
jgi:hypothetical protein